MKTHNIQYFQFIKRKSPEIIPTLQPGGFLFLGTQERVRNSRGKRAISVRATEVLLCIYFLWNCETHVTLLYIVLNLDFGSFCLSDMMLQTCQLKTVNPICIRSLLTVDPSVCL